jgi:hypothetical protein
MFGSFTVDLPPVTLLSWHPVDRGLRPVAPEQLTQRAQPAVCVRFDRSRRAAQHGPVVDGRSSL